MYDGLLIRIIPKEEEKMRNYKRYLTLSEQELIKYIKAPFRPELLNDSLGNCMRSHFMLFYIAKKRGINLNEHNP